MKLYDLKNNDKNFVKKLFIKFKKVINEGNFILGKEVSILEDKLKQFTKSKYCITTSSGTDSLLLSLMAIDVKPGDQIITSPFTFVSTLEVIALLGAKPVLVDINSKTFNINEDLIEKEINHKTKAILPVSLFGQSANMKKINKIASKYNIPVIEDASQSLGAEHYNKKSCNLSTIGVTSFFPTKTLGCYGDGGAIFTNNKQLAIKIRQLRAHGQISKYNYNLIGINGRLDTLQAAILIEKIKNFDSEVKKRQNVAKIYNKLLIDKKNIQIPFIEKFNKSVYGQYSLLIKNRKNIEILLSKNQIPFGIYYPKPMYDYKPYKKFKKNCKITDFVCKNIISIPMHSKLTFKEQKKISKLIIDGSKN